MKKLKFWHQVILGMVLGALCGHFLEEKAIIFQPIGILFINLLKMIVIPLIFFAVLYGVTSIDDAGTFGRLGSKAVAIYSITTICAVCIGLIFANIFKPGIGMGIKFNVPQYEDIQSHHTSQKTIGDILMNIIPTNPIEAMASGNTLQVVFFAFFAGFGLILIGEKGREVKNMIVSCANLVFKMVELIIKLTPYGVFAMMAWVVGQYGFSIVAGLSKFIFVVLGALLFQYILFGILLAIFGQLNPFPFYKKMRNIQALAFATSSSKATLSTAIQDLTTKIGVSKQSSSFILPLGASMNMDATAIYLGICVVFFAQIAGIELTMSQYLVVIITSTIGSIGAAGFPGGSMMMMSMVLTSVGLPIEGISLILGIDRFLDMVRTMINITGDCAVTVIVDKLEGKLNKKIYYNNELN